MLGLSIVLICAAVLCAAVLFLVCPTFGRKALREPFAGRNYAHRGLFSKDQSTPENSIPAFEAASSAGYGIELDVQFTSDRKLIVFHDDTLDRMTGVQGWVHDFPWEQVSAMSLAGTGDHPPLFSQVLETVGGRVPLIVEIKSRQEYDGAYLDDLCRATLDALKIITAPIASRALTPVWWGASAKWRPACCGDSWSIAARATAATERIPFMPLPCPTVWGTFWGGRISLPGVPSPATGRCG